jgi:hypothetical protein
VLGHAGHASGHATYGDAGHASGHATYGDAGHAGYATLWCLESWVGRKTWHLKIRWFTPVLVFHLLFAALSLFDPFLLCFLRDYHLKDFKGGVKRTCLVSADFFRSNF